LARRRVLTELMGELDQLVGGVAAGADDDDHLVAVLVGADGPARRRHDPLRRRHTRPAKLLHDQGQGKSPLWAVPHAANRFFSRVATSAGAATPAGLPGR